MVVDGLVRFGCSGQIGFDARHLGDQRAMSARLVNGTVQKRRQGAASNWDDEESVTKVGDLHRPWASSTGQCTQWQRSALLRSPTRACAEGEFQRSLHGGSSVEDSRALVVELAAPLSVDE